MVPGVVLILSINLALKKLSFEGTRAIWRSSFHTFLAKSARHKKHPSTLNTDCSALLGSISITIFSLAPYNHRKKPQSIWASHWIVYRCYKRLNECSDFFGTPGRYVFSRLTHFVPFSGSWLSGIVPPSNSKRHSIFLIRSQEWTQNCDCPSWSWN